MKNKTSINYTDIGKRIREERVKLGLSQQDLAELSELTPTNISHIERGATKLSLPSMINIANALNVSVDKLLMGVTAGSGETLKNSFMEIVEDCNHKEFLILLDNCKALKESLRKNQPLE